MDGDLGSATRMHPVVGIGSSAGGVEALKQIVTTLPEDSGASFVVVQHIGKGHLSIMDVLLQPLCPLRVEKVEDGKRLKGDTLYVMLSAGYVEVVDGVFRTSPVGRREGASRPIDHFFESLARNCAENCFGIVLSGTGTDGTIGACAIKSAGGVVAAQAPEFAAFASMPSSVIATGLTDFVLPAQDIGLRLGEVFRDRQKSADPHGDDGQFGVIEQRLPDFIALVQSRGLGDFRDYKPGTIVRRIHRRMMLGRCDSVDAYFDKISQDTLEQCHLARDFMIGVTQFFRHPDALEEVRRTALAPLVADGPDRIRVWVAGCSTGEECYSLAILLEEEIRCQNADKSFTIIGSDINESALAHARRGHYRLDKVRGLSRAYQDAYFDRDGQNVRVKRGLREKCIFNLHNVIRDVPFALVDLVSFRNTMIYFEPSAQHEALSHVHFALKPHGLLALGPSETVPGPGGPFLPVSEMHNVFCRNPDFISTGTWFPDAVSGTARAGAQGDARPPRKAARGGAQGTAGRVPVAGPEQVEQTYLSLRADPFLAVNRDLEVVYMSATMRPLLAPAAGRPAARLSTLLPAGLAQALTAASRDVWDTRQPAVLQDIAVELDDQTVLHDIFVDNDVADTDALLVTFKPVRLRNPPGGDEALDADPEGRVTALLRWSLTQAESRMREMEAECRALERESKEGDEQLLSMNEELQSSNEELDTSREELQTLNEELQTINSELMRSNDELSEQRAHLRNLLDSVDVSVVFVDGDLDVRFFTPAATELMALRDVDIGRPVSEVACRFDAAGFLDELRLFRETGFHEPRDIVLVNDAAARSFSIRLRHFRDGQGVVAGTVIVFIDVTDAVRSNAVIAAERAEAVGMAAQLKAVYDRTPVGLALFDGDLHCLRVNAEVRRITGWPLDTLDGRDLRDVLPASMAGLVDAMRDAIASGEDLSGLEYSGPMPGAPGRAASLLVSCFNVRAGNRWLGLGISILDVTESADNLRRARAAQAEAREAQVLAQEAADRMKRLFDNAPVLIAMHEGEDLIYTYTNKLHDTVTGFRNVIGKTLVEAVPEVVGTELIDRFRTVLHTGQSHPGVEFELTLETEDGSLRTDYWSQRLEPVYDAKGGVQGVLSFSYRITDLILAKEKEHREREHLRAVLDSTPIFEAILDAEGRVLDANKVAHHKLRMTLEGPERPRLSASPFWGTDPGVRADLEAAIAKAAMGEEVSLKGVELRDNASRTVHDLTCVPIRAGQDASDREVVVSAVDVTERNDAVHRAQLLLAELQHRVKNTLAVVLAISEISAELASDKQELVDALQSRLRSISRSHDRLTSNSWTGERLTRIMASELEPYDVGNRIRFEGEDPCLTPKQALSMALALHELVTNALKYGALSGSQGRVDLDCAVSEDGSYLQIDWREAGGPPVQEPTRIGFGTFLLRDVLAGDLDGEVDLQFPITGLTCKIRMPKVVTCKG